MERLAATLCLTIAVLLGSLGCDESADFQKGYTAYKSGDYATALREWTPLAEQGHTKSPSNLGLMYRFGRDVIQDNVYAHMWLNIAASSGNEIASHNRDIVAKRMTPSRLKNAGKTLAHPFSDFNRTPICDSAFV